MSRSGNQNSIRKKADNRLQRIANVLLLNASFIDNPGLLNGKMGIAIFFYHYSRYTGKKIYEDYAGELVDEIYEDINTNTPVNFENGLTGIGWGIEYLFKNKFVQADIDEALSEIDEYVSRSMLSHVITSENCNDLAGYGFYYPARLGLRCIDDVNPAVMRIKQHVTFFTDYIRRIFVSNEYPDFDFRSLTGDTISSLLRFLIETHKLRISPELVGKVLVGISEHVEPFLIDPLDSPVQSQLRLLAESIINSVPDDLLKITSRSILEKENNFLKPITESDNDTIVKCFIKSSWLNLIYGPYLRDHKTLQDDLTSLFSVIDSEDYWERQLDNLNEGNMGLNEFAGLGLGILSFAEKNGVFK